MSLNTYTLAAKPIVLSHTPLAPGQLFRDYGDTGSPEHIAAMVASGDCFLTLATTVEKIAESLEPDDIINVPELEQLAATLFYMQRYYTIEPNSSDDT